VTVVTGQNRMSVDRGEYAVIWKFMPDNWGKGLSRSEAFGVMPYFVDGEAYGRLEVKEAVELTPYRLLCRTLLSWFEPERFWTGGQQEPLHGFPEDVLEYGDSDSDTHGIWNRKALYH